MELEDGMKQKKTDLCETRTGKTIIFFKNVKQCKIFKVVIKLETNQNK